MKVLIDGMYRSWEHVLADMMMKKNDGTLKTRHFAKWLFQERYSTNEHLSFEEALVVVALRVKDRSFVENLDVFLKKLCAYEEVVSDESPFVTSILVHKLEGADIVAQLQEKNVVILPEAEKVLCAQPYKKRAMVAKEGQAQLAIPSRQISMLSRGVMLRRMKEVGFGGYVGHTTFFNFLLNVGTAFFEKQGFTSARPYSHGLNNGRQKAYFRLIQQEERWELGLASSLWQTAQSLSPREAWLFGASPC